MLNANTRRAIRGISLPLAGLAAALVLPATGHGAPRTYVVGNGGDTSGYVSGSTECGSPCTLRGAIRAANANPGKDTILLGELDISLTRSGTDNTAENGDLDISDDLIIRGEKPNNGRNIITAANADRAFHILSSAEVEFHNISIRGGSVVNAPGGGIYVSNSGFARLTNVELSGNEVRYDSTAGSGGDGLLEVSGGGIYVDGEATAIISSSDITGNTAPRNGGVSNAGRTEIRQSLIDANAAVGAGGSDPDSRDIFSNGGGVGNLGGYLSIGNSTVSNNITENQGGGIYITNRGPNVGITIITNTSITGNKAKFNGGGIANFGPATLNNSVVSNNRITTGGNGAGIYNHAAAASMDIVNSTVSGNSGANSGGGIFNSRDLTLTNSTIYDNQASSCPVSICGSENSLVGGNELAMFSTGTRNTPKLVLSNTIIADGANSDVNEPVCAGDTGFIQSIGNSMSNDDSCNLSNGKDQRNVTTLGLDPTLTASSDINGTTLEHTALHALQAASPAINAGSNTTCPSVDQRFLLRDAACDIGAYESGATEQQTATWVDLKITIADSPDPAPPNTPEEPLTYVITLTNQYVDVDAKSVVLLVTLPPTYRFSKVTMVSTGSIPSCGEPNSQNVLGCTVETLPGLGRAEFFISGIPTREGVITVEVSAFATEPDAFEQNNTKITEDTVIDPEAGDPTNFNGISGGGGGMLHPAALLLLGAAALARRRV